jgi:hypothetical protein
MDFHALQQKLFEMDPTDPREDLAKLQAQAQGSATTQPQVEQISESANVTPGSLPIMGSLDDITALAGIRKPQPTKQINELDQSDISKMLPGLMRTRSAVDEPVSPSLTGMAFDKAGEGEMMTPKQREAIAPYAKALEKVLSNARLTGLFLNLLKIADKMPADQVIDPDSDSEEDADKEQEKEESISQFRQALEAKLAEKKNKYQKDQQK